MGRGILRVLAALLALGGVFALVMEARSGGFRPRSVRLMFGIAIFGYYALKGSGRRPPPAPRSGTRQSQR